MTVLIEASLMVLAAGLLMLTAVLAIEVVAASVRRRSAHPVDAGPTQDSDASVAVIVPAHNEGAGLLPTLGDIRKELRKGDRLLVVADNCSDDTAKQAARTGAEVVVRHDRARMGKGYALAVGLEALSAAPPDIVIMIDADCRIPPGTLDRLALACLATRRPVQALNLMTAPGDARPGLRVAEFAWRVKNWARPLGLSVLGLPCPLMGTGMAFPWETLRSVDLASGALVEDVKLGLDLARLRVAPVFCPSALVISEFPQSAEAEANQRARWETGHTALLRSVPRLMGTALAERNLPLFVMALDLAIPPLTLLALLVAGVFVASVSFAALGLGTLSLLLAIASLGAFLLAIGLSWFRFGRAVLPARTLVRIPGYMFCKLPLYGRIIAGRAGTAWVRTERRKT
jgi:cellulose synthase/poly-beta-1,6-N-acetylglucosamine synthase-like glycosyltransferase